MLGLQRIPAEFSKDEASRGRWRSVVVSFQSFSEVMSPSDIRTSTGEGLMSYRIGDFELDRDRYELRSRGSPAKVEPRVLDVLFYLAEHPSRLISKDELLSEVWQGQIVGESALTRAIYEARHALGEDGHAWITTVHGKGYRFSAEVEPLAESTDDKAPSAFSFAAILVWRLEGEESPWREKLLSAIQQGGGNPRGREFGSGELALFDRASKAVACALEIQAAMDGKASASLRAAIHAGERMEGEVVSEALETADLLLSLAEANQILLSRTIFDSARRQPADEGEKSKEWRAHGAYVFRDQESALHVFEVGVGGSSRLAPPKNKEHAQRAVVSGFEESTLGWRPGPGLAIPNQPDWRLLEGLGEGGYGEVWLATHVRSGASRVFKFCFDSERVRGLRREVVLFRLLKESLGARSDIAAILDWRLDEPPYYLEAEYSEAGDLRAWSKRHGGIANLPVADRLELIAQTAEALAAAHSAGILHRDLKPANVLVAETAHGPSAILSDFGIGLVTSREALEGANVTRHGLTETLLAGSSGSDSGTRLYQAPELLEGRPASVQSDLYALGVMLYQAIAGDFGKALAPGWERDIEDDLLREEIALCVERDRERRIGNAGQLAQRLRGLEGRRAERLAEERLRRQAAAQSRRRRQFSIALVAAVVIALLATVIAIRERARAKRDREALYVADVRLAEGRLEQGRPEQATALLQQMAPEHRGWEWGYLARTATASTLSAVSDSGTRVGVTAAQLWQGAQPMQVGSLSGHRPLTMFAGQVAFTGDALRLLSQAVDGPARLFDLASGEQIRQFRGETWIHSLIVSPDDRFVVTFEGGANPGQDPLAVISDLETGEELQRLRFEKLTKSGSLSADGSLVAVVSVGTRSVLETSTGVVRLQIPLEGEADAPALFLGGGERVAVPGGRSTVAVWNLATGLREVEYPLPLEDDRFVSSVLSVGNRLGAVDCGRSGDLGAVWDVRSGEKILDLELAANAGERHVVKALLSQDQTLAVVLLDDGTLTLPALVANDERGLRSNGSLVVPGLVSDRVVPLTGLGLSSAGDRVAYIDPMDGVIRILAPGSRTSRGRDRLEVASEPVFQLAFSADGALLATATMGGEIAIWDVGLRERLLNFEAHQGPIYRLSWSPDGRLILSEARDGKTVLWDARLGTPRVTRVFEPMVESRGHVGPALLARAGYYRSRRFAPDSQRVLMAAGLALQVVDADSGRTLVAGPADTIAGASLDSGFDPSGKQVNSNGRLWSSVSGDVMHELADYSWQLTTEYSSDGRNLVGGNYNGEVTVWDAKTGLQVLGFSAQPARVRIESARFSPDGKMLLTASADGTAKLWNSGTGDLLSTFCCQSSLLDASFSASGRRVLTLSRREGVAIWDLRGNELLRLDLESTPFRAVWSPDEKVIAVALDDGTVQLWEAESWLE